MIIGTREGELLKITNDKDFDTISHENKEAIHEIKFSRDEKTLAVASYVTKKKFLFFYQYV